MANRVTITQVAKHAGVALGTVSRVLNNHGTVGADIRERVLKSIDELGYEPDFAAQSMRNPVTRTIGIILRDLTVPAVASFVRAAEGLFNTRGYALLIGCSEDDIEKEMSILRLMKKRRIDGLILMSSSDDSEQLLNFYASLNVPLVMLDRDAPAFADRIGIDHSGGIKAATDYLFDLGHERIAMVTGPDNIRPGRERVIAFKNAFERRGLPLDTTLLRAGSYASDFGFSQASHLLDLKLPPTAIISGGISMLPGILRAVKARNLRIPEDISLIGYGDSDLAEFSQIPTTVVRWNYDEIGMSSATMLMERLVQKSNDPPKRVIFPTELIIRGSCSRPR